MRVEVYPNQNGLRGTERTISHMRRLVESGKTDPAVVLKAHQIVKNIDRNDWTKMASTIFNFVHDNIAYVRDPVGVEFVKSPAITLRTKTGDCDDQSVLFSALAESVGINTRFKAVKADPKYPGEFSHVYSQALIPSKGWVTADTIVPKAKFGWEAKGFSGRTWGGEKSMSFISGPEAKRLLGRVFANGAVSGGALGELGDAFGEGGMWDDEPMMTSGKGEASTIVDADDDFWGGSTDTPPGPGFVSRMRRPSLDRPENSEMSGWPASMFKKWGKEISKTTKKWGSELTKVGKGITKGIENVGNAIAKGIGMSTKETRDKASRNACNEALKPLYEGDNIQVAVELLRRCEGLVEAVKAGKVPEYVQGPPATMQGFSAALGATNIAKWGMDVISKSPLGPYMQALNIVKSLGDAEDIKAAEDALKRYVEGFPVTNLNSAIENAMNAYVAAGGILPMMKDGVLADKPPADWAAAFWSSVVPKDAGNKGNYYYALIGLMDRLNKIVPGLNAAKGLFQVAQKAHDAVIGKETIETSASVVQQAMSAGTVSPAEAAAALQITKKTAEGYALTPQEQDLAARIAAGAKQAQAPALPKGLMIALPAAAAAAAALLL